MAQQLNIGCSSEALMPLLVSVGITQVHGTQTRMQAIHLST